MNLKDIFELIYTDNGCEAIEFEGSCMDCGAPVTVLLSKTGTSLSIEGGSVFKTGITTEPYWLKCEDCFKKDPHFEKKSEVYSRQLNLENLAEA